MIALRIGFAALLLLSITGCATLVAPCPENRWIANMANEPSAP